MHQASVREVKPFRKIKILIVCAKNFRPFREQW